MRLENIIHLTQSSESWNFIFELLKKYNSDNVESIRLEIRPSEKVHVSVELLDNNHQNCYDEDCIYDFGKIYADMFLDEESGINLDFDSDLYFTYDDGDMIDDGEAIFVIWELLS